VAGQIIVACLITEDRAIEDRIIEDRATEDRATEDRIIEDRGDPTVRVTNGRNRVAIPGISLRMHEMSMSLVWWSRSLI
jgi:hypothetical protein